MALNNIKEFLEKEMDKLSQKSSTCMSDQELLKNLLCNYEYTKRLINEEVNIPETMYGLHKSGHSMRDREIEKLEEKLKEASSNYERDFYKKLIQAAQQYE